MAIQELLKLQKTSTWNYETVADTFLALSNLKLRNSSIFFMDIKEIN